MSLPTTQQFLDKLQANPADAAAFDRCQPSMSRREHVESVLNAVHATIAETLALKAKLSASRAKIAAIEAARKSQPVSIMKTTVSTPTKAPTLNTISAAEFTKPQGLFMALAEFNKLTHPQRNKFIRDGGKLI